MDCSPPDSSVHRIFQARILEWVAIAPPANLPNPGIKPMSLAWQADSLPLSHLGSPVLSSVCEKYVLGSQLYLTLWNPMNYRLSGSSGHGILWARILEWVTIPFSRGSSQSRGWTQVSCTTGGLLTIWATREACSLLYMDLMEHYTWYFLWNPTHHFFLYLLSYFRSHFKCHCL